MNKKQLVVLAIGIIAVAACFLYPPWKSPIGQEHVFDFDWIQYRLIWEPPSYSETVGFPGGPSKNEQMKGEIAWQTLLTEVGGVTVFVVLLVFLLRNQQRKNSLPSA